MYPWAYLMELIAPCRDLSHVLDEPEWRSALIEFPEPFNRVSYTLESWQRWDLDDPVVSYQDDMSMWKNVSRTYALRRRNGDIVTVDECVLHDLRTASYITKHGTTAQCGGKECPFFRELEHAKVLLDLAFPVRST